MRLAKRVFTAAGIYGLIVMAPMYFLEGAISRATGPVTYPEHFYGFVGAAVAFQVLFLAIGRDPLRLRPAMIAAVIEKFSFGAAVWWLFAQGRVQPPVVVFSTIDLAWGVLFAISYLRTRPAGG